MPTLKLKPTEDVSRSKLCLLPPDSSNDGLAEGGQGSISIAEENRIIAPDRSKDPTSENPEPSSELSNADQAFDIIYEDSMGKRPPPVPETPALESINDEVAELVNYYRGTMKLDHGARQKEMLDAYKKNLADRRDHRQFGNFNSLGAIPRVKKMSENSDNQASNRSSTGCGMDSELSAPEKKFERRDEDCRPDIGKLKTGLKSSVLYF